MDEIMSIESTGKSVDEAIFKGLQKLGISLDEADIVIISTETKGFLGIGAKPAVVRLTKKLDEKLNISEIMRGESGRRNEQPRREKPKKEGNREKKNRPEEGSDDRGKKPEAEERSEIREEKKPRTEDKPEERPEKSPDASEGGMTEPKPEKRAGKKPENPEKKNVSRETINNPAGDVSAKTENAPETEAAQEAQEAGTEAPKAERSPRTGRNQRSRRDRRKPAPKTAEAENTEAFDENEPVKAEPEKVINYTLEAAEGNPAAEFVKGLIERMGASGQVLAAQDEDCLRLRIDSEMMGMLIGHRGETLDAMQYLTGLVINKNRKVDGYTRVTLNTEEYREKREETLKRLAKKVAAQVRATGRPRVLEPMNPYERRVLHSTLQNNPDVTTHSEGEEPNRRVVVTPKRRSGRGYTRNKAPRKSFEPKPAADNEDDGTISREEYERLYAQAKAASPMYAVKKTEEN